jgi:hypothetical protein
LVVEGEDFRDFVPPWTELQGRQIDG